MILWVCHSYKQADRANTFGIGSEDEGLEVELEEDELGDDDEGGDEDGDDMSIDFENRSSRRSTSPSKLTARQRAKGNKDLQDTLIALPNGESRRFVVYTQLKTSRVDAPGKKPIPIMTEAEKGQKKEEMARRRKRQTEQKLQDEQVSSLNHTTPCSPPLHVFAWTSHSYTRSFYKRYRAISNNNATTLR
jgi:hypothetical protein